MNPTIRKVHAYVPVAVRAAHAQSRWESLAADLDAGASCDERLCAKRAKLRKQAWRSERRAVRQLLRDAVPE